jgi:hypothetical protein
MEIMEVGKETHSDLQVFCHKHYAKLEPAPLGRGDQGALTIVYSCRKPACPVHYNSSQGYFIRGENGNTTLTDFAASVRCLNDGMPMYLARVLPDKKSFRLWKCPVCDTIVAMNP